MSNAVMNYYKYCGDLSFVIMIWEEKKISIFFLLPPKRISSNVVTLKQELAFCNSNYKEHSWKKSQLCLMPVFYGAMWQSICSLNFIIKKPNRCFLENFSPKLNLELNKSKSIYQTKKYIKFLLNQSCII